MSDGADRSQESALTVTAAVTSSSASSQTTTDLSRPQQQLSEDSIIEDETELTLALETSLALITENHRLREEKTEAEQRLHELELECEEYKSLKRDEIPSLLSTIEYYKQQLKLMEDESERRDELLAMRESEVKNLSLKMEQSEAERAQLHRELTRLSSAVHLTSDSDDDVDDDGRIGKHDHSDLIIPHSLTMPSLMKSSGGIRGSQSNEASKDDFSVGGGSSESSSSSATRRRNNANHMRSSTMAVIGKSSHSLDQARDASKAAWMIREDRKKSKREMRIEIASLQVQLDQQLQQINELLSEVELGREWESKYLELDKEFKAVLLDNESFAQRHEILNQNYIELTYDKIALDQVLEETQSQLDAALRRERDYYAHSQNSSGIRRGRRGSISEDESSGAPGVSSVMNSSRTLRRRLSKKLKADYSEHSLLYEIAHRFKSSSEIDTDEEEENEEDAEEVEEGSPFMRSSIAHERPQLEDEDEEDGHEHHHYTQDKNEEVRIRMDRMMMGSRGRRGSTDDLSSAPDTTSAQVTPVGSGDGFESSVAGALLSMNDASVVEAGDPEESVTAPVPVLSDLEKQVQSLAQTTETEDSISSLSALQQIENDVMDDQKVIEEPALMGTGLDDMSSSMLDSTKKQQSTQLSDASVGTVGASLSTSFGITDVSVPSKTKEKKKERMPDPPKLEIFTDEPISLKAIGSRPSEKSRLPPTVAETSVTPAPAPSSSASAPPPSSSSASTSSKGRHTDAYNEFLHLSAAAAKINYPSVFCTSKELIDRVAGLPFYQVSETMNRYLMAKLQWQNHEVNQLAELERASIEANRAVKPGASDTGDGLSAAVKEATSLSKWWSRMWGASTSSASATASTAAASADESKKPTSEVSSASSASARPSRAVPTISEGKYSGHGIIQRTQSGGLSFTVGPLLSSLDQPDSVDEPGLIFSGVHTTFTPGSVSGKSVKGSAGSHSSSASVRSGRPRRRSSVNYTVPPSRFYRSGTAIAAASAGSGGGSSTKADSLPRVAETKPL